VCWRSAPVFLQLVVLLRLLKELVEHAVVQFAVVVVLVLLVDFFHARPEHDRLALLHDQLLHRVRKHQLRQVRLSRVERCEDLGSGFQISQLCVMGRVQVLVREVERLLVHDCVQSVVLVVLYWSSSF